MWTKKLFLPIKVTNISVHILILDFSLLVLKAFMKKEPHVQSKIDLLSPKHLLQPPNSGWISTPFFLVIFQFREMLGILHFQQTLISIWLCLSSFVTNSLKLIHNSFENSSSVISKSPLILSHFCRHSFHLFALTGIWLSPVDTVPRNSLKWKLSWSFSPIYLPAGRWARCPFYSTLSHTNHFSLKTYCSLQAHAFQVCYPLTIPTGW